MYNKEIDFTAVTNPDKAYKYTVIDRIKNAINFTLGNKDISLNYNPFDFGIIMVGPRFYHPKTKSTPITRFKNFIRMFKIAYLYTPDTVEIWNKNKKRLQCQEKQLNALVNPNPSSSKDLFSIEEATCVLWHDDIESQVTKQLENIPLDKAEDLSKWIR